MFSPGQITSRCFPSESEASFTIESYDSLNYLATIERVPVSSMMNEGAAFELELARVRKVRMQESEWEPITVRLLLGDQEIRKEIVL